ncbi:hypothetical protein [Treponema sp. UBA6852]|nr:hypothetical protein [Treponema sp. UBA6852]
MTVTELVFCATTQESLTKYQIFGSSPKMTGHDVIPALDTGIITEDSGL